ncbi:MAG: PIN domain-containing protein [Acidobacteriota bacterium]
MERLFVDTSAWYALANGKARRHAEVKKTLAAWEGRLCTTDYIFDELVTLVRYRVGHKPAVTVGEALREGGVCLLVAVEPQDIHAAWEHFAREADQRYSFTDCTSFAVMRRLKLTTAAALDEDFARAGFVVVPA